MKHVASSPYLRHSFVFFVGSLLVAVINYLFYPIMGRLLKPEEFGEVQTLISVLAQAGVFLTVLSFLTIHITVNNLNDEERNRILLSLERIALLIAGGVVGVALLFSSSLQRFLQFNDIKPFFALALALLISIPLAFRMAFLRGKTFFSKSVKTDAVGSLIKLVLSPLLVIVGWGSLGAMTGLAVSQVISLAFGMFWAHKYGFKGFGLRIKGLAFSKLSPQLKHSAAVLVISLVVTFLLSIDIIVVKHYFQPYEAGLYAGLTTIARTIFFVAAPFTGVLITMVSLNNPMLKNRQRLLATIFLIGAIGGCTLLVFKFFPETIIKLLVGQKYVAYAEYLVNLGLAMLLLCVSNCLLMYHVALKRYSHCFMALIATLLTFFLFAFGGHSITDVINTILTGNVVLLVLVIANSLITNSTNREVAYGT